MASSLLNKLKLIAGESIDTTDPTNPDDPYKYVNKYLKEYNITNPYIINAIKGVISSEGGVKGKPEMSYANNDAAYIKKIFGSRATKYTNEELDVIKKDPVKFYDMVYGPEAMSYYTDRKKGAWNPGNDQPGDGYKYRGRGLNQLTFKSQYKAVSDRLKKRGYDIDLVKNPELLDTDPDIQALVAIEFITDRLNKLSNSNSNLYKKKREQYNVNNWKDIDDQETASLVLANVQSGFGKTPRKEYQENVYNASLKFIPVQPTEGSRLNLVAEKANQVIEGPGVDEVLADIKYKPQVPKMPFGTSQEDVQNYLAEKQAYEQRALDQDLSVEELGAQELAAYEANPRSFDTFENMAQNTPLAQSTTASGDFGNTMTDEEYDALGIEKPFSEPQIFKQNVDLPEVSVGRSKKEEIIPLVETEIDENKYDNLEFLNTLHQPRSIISEGSFTNEARSKEQLKRDAAAEKFISDPLQQSAKSGYFGSGQSMFYPSTRQQKYGGAMAPIIPTWDYPSEKTFVRDTTSLPFNYGGILENGGSEDGEIGKPTNPINTSKGLFGMLGDAAKYSAARNMSKTELPEQGDLPDSEYLSTLNRKELSSIPFKKQMANRDVKSEKYFVEGVQKRMSDIGLERSQYNTPMKEDYDYLGVPFMYDKDSWFHNLKGNKYADPYSCQGIACAIGRKAGAVNAQDYKTRSAKGKANKPWAIETGSLTVDHADVLAGKGLYPVENIQPGDMVRHGYKSPYGTGHNVIATGKSYISHNDEIEFPAAYASEWEGGVKGSSNYYFDPKTDQAFRYLRNLPRLEKEAVAAKSMYEKYQDYLDKKAIAKIPIKEAELIRTGPTKMPFIERKQYPNTRRGRKQEQQDNAYIEAYMARMQKK